ncbi:hypothetical protein V5O48_018642 [Marasmius crinis-equi]|uniref:Protein kinase domain-containing protein n=1 Tax=Marasmius crinis-equi TaxID=585013 RepID=A0ABR3EKQ8_9AGAR
MDKRDGCQALTGGGFADLYKGTLARKIGCLKALRVHTADSEREKEKIIAANVLVDKFFRCRLADFGLADAATETTVMHITSGGIKGPTRWMAPEMYAFTMGMNTDKKPKEDKLPRDIYAFACTILEVRSRASTAEIWLWHFSLIKLFSAKIMTGKPPFHNLIDTAVMYRVSMHHIRPKWPLEKWCPDHIWSLVELCWHEDPSKRPYAKILQTYLQNLLDARNPFSGDPHFIGYFKPGVQSRGV